MGGAPPPPPACAAGEEAVWSACACSSCRRCLLVRLPILALCGRVVGVWQRNCYLGVQAGELGDVFMESKRGVEIWRAE
jgi:hypothetical protein